MTSTKPIGRRPTPFRQRAAGFTLVELMVGLAIGMLISIAAASVIAVTESSRRTTQVGNDMGQVASYTTMLLDRAIRSAGSGFAPAASYAYGCKLFAAKSGTQVLPLPSAGALPAPFASVTTGTAGVFRLVPVVIGNGQTTPAISGSASDVLIVMAGTAGQGEAPMLFSALSQSATLTVGSTVGLAANDQLLVVDRQPSSTGTADCLVSQVSSTFTSSSQTSIALAGAYYSATVDSLSMTGFSTDGAAIALGNLGAGNPPGFMVYGVGANNTLYSYDLLQAGSSAALPLVDGVFELQALYGLDTSGDGVIDSWSAPTGSYALSALMDGSSTAAGRLRQIIAISLGLILRGNRDEVGQFNSVAAAKWGKSLSDYLVAPASLTLFSDLGSGLTYTRDLTNDERKFRYRVVETTIPVRNNLLLPS